MHVSKAELRLRKIQAVMSRDGSCCHLCGATLTTKTATLDHVIPKSLGGTLAFHNVKLACLRCNSFRGNMPVEEAREKLRKAA